MATRTDADLVLRHHQRQMFSSNPNLVKLSVVPVTDAVGRPTAEYILEAGVLNLAVQISAQSAGQGEYVPSKLAIPDLNGALTKNEISVRVVQVGEIKALSVGLAPPPAPISILSYTNRVRPVNGGNSIGNARYNNAGTFGSVVKLAGDSSNRYFLSNWHVLADGSGQAGDPIVQPGRLDGGSTPGDVIGTLFWFILNDDFDAALGLASAPWQNFVSHGFRCYSTYRDIPVDPIVNQPVTKCGRTTELTNGTILSVNASVRVTGYPTGTRLFTNQIETTVMSAPGDSGSVLFHSDDMSPVGLLFAGGATRTYHNNLKKLFDTQFGALQTTNAAGDPVTLPAVTFEQL